MKDILTEIVANKRKELREQTQQAATANATGCDGQRNGLRPRVNPTASRSMSRALASSPTGIIAEFKRKSPSRGWIHRDAVPTDVVPQYEGGGASALSILTDEVFFGGSTQYIEQVRPLVSIPILRKDFIIDPVQIDEAKRIGADAILLIAACLERQQCHDLLGKAHELGLEVLLEVHSEPELEYVEDGVDMVGINNRNLGTFVTDVANSFRLADKLAAAVSGFSHAPVLVSESGISKPETIRQLRAAGFRGFLMGEAFMKTDNPGLALRQLIEAL